MKKGDLVMVSGVVWTKELHVYFERGNSWNGSIVHHPDPKHKYSRYQEERTLQRAEYSKPWAAIVIGYSMRQTGWYESGSAEHSSYDGDDYGSAGSLSSVEYHKVWMVMPLNNQRYVKPFACLESDLEYLNPEDDPNYDPIPEENYHFPF